jgi:pimeloyl-ACP methyl ester carboxylesterase
MLPNKSASANSGRDMPFISTDDGIKLYCEETGSGMPVVFVHEFAGDCRSWEPQVRYLSRRYRCITFNARGWPPSDVPQDVASYSQARACDDIRSVLDGLAIDKAHIVGLSMGGLATLHFGLTYPDRALSLLVAGAGYGSESSEREKFRSEAVVSAGKLEKDGMAAFAQAYAYGPTRVQFENKDPRGFAEFKAMLAEHSAKGSANTQLVFIKRTCPSAGLLVLPNSGHTINLEEPGAFSAALADFLAQVDAGRWPMRDARAISGSITGMTK